MLKKLLLTFATLCLLLAAWPGYARADGGPTGGATRLGTGVATSVAAAPNGKVVAVGASIGVWFFTADLQTVLGFWDTGAWVERVNYSTDGRYLRANDLVWDTSLARAVPIVPAETVWLEHTCSPEGRYCARLSQGSTATIVKDQDTLIDVALVTTGMTHDVAWSADGRTLYAAGERVTVWAMPAGEKIADKTGFFTNSLYWLAWSPDGQTIATDGLAWQANTGQPASPARCPRNWDIWPPLVYDCHARAVWTGYEVWDTEIWVFDDPQVYAYRSLEPHTAGLYAAHLSGDGKRLVTAGRDFYEYACGPDDPRFQNGGTCSRTIDYTRVWDADTLAMLAQLPVGFTDVGFIPNSNWVAGRASATLEVWDWTTGQRVWSAPARIGRLAISPTGDYLAANDGATVSVWRAATGERTATLTGHTRPSYSAWSSLNMYGHRWPFGVSPITGLAFSPDGTRLAASGGDGTILVWPVP